MSFINIATDKHRLTNLTHPTTYDCRLSLLTDTPDSRQTNLFDNHHHG
jgi:hypothetical protein